MRLLPKSEFTVETDVPVEVVWKRLADNVEPGWKWFFLWRHKTFQGDLWTDGFRIRRVRGVSGVLPFMEGRFERTSGGTIVHTLMKLPRFTVVFTWVFLIAWAVPFLVYLATAIADMAAGKPATIPWEIVMMTVGGVAVIFLALHAGFRLDEAPSCRRLLTNVLLGKTGTKSPCAELKPGS